MENYTNLLRKIMIEGCEKDDRTGIGTKAIFGASLEFNLDDGFPILTTRKIALRISFEETWMFLRGVTDTTTLENKKIFIWKDNTSREFLDSRGLQHLPVGSLGTGYSHQWRNYGGTVGKNDGVDQIKNLLDGLKKDPNSRRHIVVGWNPSQLDGTPLPPCHIMNQYAVNNGRLDSSFIMRSTDVYHGLPYNIMGYSLLNVVFAKYLGLKPGKVVYFGNDVHIYKSQFHVVNQQLERQPRLLPTLKIQKELKTLDDILDMEYTDVVLEGYAPHDALERVSMAV